MFRQRRRTLVSSVAAGPATEKKIPDSPFNPLSLHHHQRASAMIIRYLQLSNFILTAFVRIGAGMGSSFVTNGLNNVVRSPPIVLYFLFLQMNGKKFTENWKSALVTGFIIGYIGTIADGLRQFNAQAAQSVGHLFPLVSSIIISSKPIISWPKHSIKSRSWKINTTRRSTPVSARIIG